MAGFLLWLLLLVFWSLFKTNATWVSVGAGAVPDHLAARLAAAAGRYHRGRRIRLPARSADAAGARVARPTSMRRTRFRP